MAFGNGKAAVLSERDKKFVDEIISGRDRREVYGELYPERIGTRTEKQIKKAIRDLLQKPKVKEYRKSLEKNSKDAFEEAMKNKAEAICDNIMSKEELMSMYSNIARDEDESTNNRLRAADSLAKYLFGLDKKSVELDANVSNDIIINVIDDIMNDEEDE